jgi:protein-tyrosine-phosphatase
MTAQWGSRAAVHGVLADANRLAVLHHVALSDRTPKELSAALGIPQPLVTHHLNVLADSGLITRTASEHDRRQRFISIHSSALAYLDRQWLRDQLPASSQRIVFACTHNSARSVLASALWADRLNRPTSAGGTTPGSRIHPQTIRTARRHEVSLLQDAPVPLDDVLDESDLLVTVCDAANHHIQSHPLRLHWSVPDPATNGDDRSFEAAFEQIVARIERLGSAFEQTTIKEREE